MINDGYREDTANILLNVYIKNYDYALSANGNTHLWHEIIPLENPRKTIENYFQTLERILELKKEGKNVLIHCSAGKHRTGLTAMLIEVANKGGTLSDEEILSQYLNFIKFNWHGKASTKTRYMIVLNSIIRSLPFQDFSRRWQQSLD